MHPFRDRSAGTAGDLGERHLIEAIRQWLGPASPPSPRGIGDDCAVFELTPGSQGLVTTDPVVWGRHFDESIAPADVAAKLVKRNLSDIAAMGGRPVAAVVSLLLPKETSVAWLEGFHHGLRAAGERYGAAIAGGDVTQTEGLLCASLTLIGESVAGRILRRDGASTGDRLLVTGTLGGSILGHHFGFEPRLAEGQWLSTRPEVTAAMDVSDGLAKDLLAFLPEGAEANLVAATIPVSDAALSRAHQSGRSALSHALCDGEDYELLVAVDPKSDVETLLLEWRRSFPDLPLTLIGEIRTGSSGAQITGLPDSFAEKIAGYEHLT